MRTTEAARYARWAAGAAFVLAALVAGAYAHRAWQARQVRKQAPPEIPARIQQQSAEFSFSKVEKDRTLFTVRASRATQFKEGNRNLLEDVWITIYGRTGARSDNIHTRECEYLPGAGRIVCAGDVEMDLESAEDARLHPGQARGANPAAHVIQVTTKNVTFDRESGDARTEQPVTFRFPYGEGRGVGVFYSTGRGVVRLEHNVELTLRQSHTAASAGRAPPPVTLTGGSLEYHHDSRTMRLVGPVRAIAGPRELSAGEVRLELDASYRAKRLVANHQPEMRSTERGGKAVLAADEMGAVFHPRGWTERAWASGHVLGNRSGTTGTDHLEAEQLEVEMVPGRNQPHTMTASGGVKADSNHRDESRRLETAAMRLFFLQGAKQGSQRLERAETLAPATVELDAADPAGGKNGRQVTLLRGQQLATRFDARNALEQLTGSGGVEIERRLPGRAPQVSISHEFAVKFIRGDWAEVEQTGGVRLRQADRIAEGERGRLERATGVLTLTGGVTLTEPASLTTAQSASFNERTGELRADGDVRSSELAAGRRGVTNFASQPAHISAEHLVANAKTNRAVYTGRARLWQGDSVIEADSIELQRDARLLMARDNVRAVFPQATPPAGGPAGSSPGITPSPTGRSGRVAGGGPDLWRVRAGMLTYWSGEGRARLEEDVHAESRQGKIASRVLELFFASAGSASGSATPSKNGAGAQQLTRAVATTNVIVQQGDRRGTADRAEYIPAGEKFILSGGHPTLYDGYRGTTTGRQLTFFFADDTIVVDSEEGTRTLTRHRVEK